jgi:hypothetical protein
MVRNLADRPEAFRFVPLRLAFAMPSAISAIVTVENKRRVDTPISDSEIATIADRKRQ